MICDMQYCKYQGCGKVCTHPLNKNKDGITYGCSTLFEDSEEVKEYKKWLEPEQCLDE